MRNALKKLKCFKENEQNFHFIKVIAKENKYINRELNEYQTEKKWNLEDLKKKSLDLNLGKKGLILPLWEESNKQLYKINKEIEIMEEEVQKNLEELMKKK